MTRRSFLCFLLVLTLLAGVLPAASAESAALTDEQANAIAMLNYITVLTQDINASKNSRLYMEEAYSSLVNNTYPNAVDSRTLSQLTGLLDTMEGYRMVAVKRERLRYIYEQNQAEGIRSALPNALSLISIIQSYRPSKIAASIAYMVIDSVTSYTAYTSEKDLQYLKEGWALDDQYWFLHDAARHTADADIEFGGTAVILPVVCCSDDAEITVSVLEADAEAPVVLTDWAVQSVERVTEGSMSTYRAVYTSEAARHHDWQPGASIQLDVQPKADATLPVYHLEFTTEGTKKAWYDYLKIWEGHKNNWYDYAKVWENSVVFEQVK